MVLANGLGTSQDTWRFVVAALGSRVQVVRFDYAGMSPHTEDAFEPVTYATLHGFADDVRGLLGEAGLRDVLFVGHSVSGMIGAIAAAVAPDLIARLVMINAAPRYLDGEAYQGGFTDDMLAGTLAAAKSDFRAWAAGFAPLAIGPEATDEGIAEFSGYLRRMRPDVGLMTLRTILEGDYRSVLPRVTQPVTLLQSREDVVVPWSVSEYLQAHLPNAELFALNSRGHLPQLTAAGEVISALELVLDAWEQSAA